MAFVDAGAEALILVRGRAEVLADVITGWFI